MANPIIGAASARGAGAVSRSTWLHNSSTVYLVASGASREFYYQTPRVWNVRDNANKAIRNSDLYSNKTPAEYLECD